MLDSGGGGSPILFLHGLAGHGAEWVDTARALRPTHRVIAPDARGHGYSSRRPDDVSPGALADDVAFLVHELGIDSPVLVGHSWGGITALHFAATHGELLAGLVVVEAGPAASSEPEIAETVDYLASWPVPFADRATAERFFGGPSLRARRWVDGLESCRDGLRPRFEPALLEKALRGAIAGPRWSEWAGIGCPTMVVSGSEGTMAADELERMAATNGAAIFRTVGGAGHDLHLEAFDRWSAVLSGFLDSVDRGSS